MYLDLTIIVGYIIVINIIGILFSKNKTTTDYFLGGRSIPWWAASFSIVATETSTLTFISIPGVAFLTGLGFLQVALGYIVGRIIVAYFFIPQYFKGEIKTLYEYLQQRYSPLMRRIVSVVFHVIRLLADGIRLFATAIPLALLMKEIFGFGDFRIAILIIGVATLQYTYFGGIRSVIIVDSIQMVLYIVCAATAIWFVAGAMDLSLGTLLSKIDTSQFMFFKTGLEDGAQGFFQGYTLFSGLIGGALLSIGSHGTDYLLVQRVLTCKNEKDAKKAMISSGFFVFLQFFLFLIFGLVLMFFLKGQHFSRPDEIVPFFIIKKAPPGFRGLMLAGIFAAAMSSLSSSINSLSASTLMDVLQIKNLDEKKALKLSKIFTLIWAAVIMLFAMAITSTKNPLVELGLSIASFVYGGLLTIFFFTIMKKEVSQNSLLTGFLFSTVAVVIIWYLKIVFWPWLVVIGFLISFVTVLIMNFFKKVKQDY